MTCKSDHTREATVSARRRAAHLHTMSRWFSLQLGPTKGSTDPGTQQLMVVGSDVLESPESMSPANGG